MNMIILLMLWIPYGLCISSGMSGTKMFLCVGKSCVCNSVPLVSICVNSNLSNMSLCWWTGRSRNWPKQRKEPPRRATRTRNEPPYPTLAHRTPPIIQPVIRRSQTYQHLTSEAGGFQTACFITHSFKLIAWVVANGLALFLFKSSYPQL